jgi:hypothetical protein
MTRTRTALVIGGGIAGPVAAMALPFVFLALVHLLLRRVIRLIIGSSNELMNTEVKRLDLVGREPIERGGPHHVGEQDGDRPSSPRSMPMERDSPGWSIECRASHAGIGERHVGPVAAVTEPRVGPA